MPERILPSFERSPDHPLDTFRMRIYLLFGRKEIVSVKIDTEILRVDYVNWDPALFENEWLIRNEC